MNALPTEGIKRLLFFRADRWARLRRTREDLAATGGPAPSTLYKTGQRKDGLAPRTLARPDFRLGSQEGSAQRVLLGGSPDIRISEQFNACLSNIDATLRGAECGGVWHWAEELKNFLLGVAQRPGDFYTEPVRTVGVGADAGSC